MSHKHTKYAMRDGSLEDITGQKPTVTELDWDDMDALPFRHVEGEDIHDEIAYYISMLSLHFTIMSNMNKSRFGMVVSQLACEYLGDTFYRYARIEKPKDGV